jgi:DNA-binding response OmpR family regulator
MTAGSVVSQGRKRILYIEHSEDSREMLTVTLEIAGYEMATAKSVATGVSLARLKRFDLYILDGRFTDGTGLDLCRSIRALDTDTPIIFYSSDAYASDIKAGLEAGAQYYLTKPAGIYEIEQTVERCLLESNSLRLMPGKGSVHSARGGSLRYRRASPAR